MDSPESVKENEMYKILFMKNERPDDQTLW